jgi:autotransporter translocation and assembly factor TamB
LSVEGTKTADDVNAHLVVDKLRLDSLPEIVADPHLHLAGTLDVDVKASGETDNPRVSAHVALKQARFQGYSRLYAKLDATLADQVVDGSLSAEAPFTAAEARFKVPTDVLAAGTPLDFRLDVTRFDLGDALRGAPVAAPADGKLTLRMQASGTANDPKVDVVINAKDLSVARPATPNQPRDVVDLGHARIHFAYARRTARAEIDFASSHGGSLKVDGAAKVDLSYPRVTRGIVAAKIPIEGKVVARDLDVAWISRFNERVESLGGQVNANAKLAGTVGDPQFLGDVRWKNGNVVATVPQKTTESPKKTSASARRDARPARRR